MARQKPVVLISGQLTELASTDVLTGTTVTTATVNFGSTVESCDATVTVADTSVTATSRFQVMPSLVATTDHDPDDYVAEQVMGYVGNVVVATGYDVIAVAPQGTWGQYSFYVTIG
jgi:hypothetical protein